MEYIKLWDATLTISIIETIINPQAFNNGELKKNTISKPLLVGG
jgi:hypothetical protein